MPKATTLETIAADLAVGKCYRVISPVAGSQLAKILDVGDSARDLIAYAYLDPKTLAESGGRKTASRAIFARRVQVAIDSDRAQRYLELRVELAILATDGRIHELARKRLARTAVDPSYDGGPVRAIDYALDGLGRPGDAIREELLALSARLMAEK